MTFAFTLCADDYGMTAGVSRGILEVAAAGRISAASAMTGMPDWPRAAQAWRAAAPPADLGLHVNLTVGAPLGDMARFAPSGRFPAIGALIRSRALPEGELVDEIGRQIDAFVALAGRPAHIDGHQHVHLLPGVRGALFTALSAKVLNGVVVRDSGDRLLRIVQRRGQIGKALVVAQLARGFGDAVFSRGFDTNDGFAGFSSFSPDADLEKQFRSFLRAPGQRHLVMCHPGYADAALAAIDPVTTSRDAELTFLLSHQWADVQRESGAIMRPGGQSRLT